MLKKEERYILLNDLKYHNVVFNYRCCFFTFQQKILQNKEIAVFPHFNQSRPTEI